MDLQKPDFEDKQLGKGIPYGVFDQGRNEGGVSVGIRVLAGQGASIDTTTASGKLVFALFAALEEFERELIRERTLAGLASARARGQEGRAPSRAEQSAGAASSGSDGAARHEGQRAMPRARRNQGDDLPLRSARWFLEKPRATGPGSLGGPKSGP